MLAAELEASALVSSLPTHRKSTRHEIAVPYAWLYLSERQEPSHLTACGRAIHRLWAVDIEATVPGGFGNRLHQRHIRSPCTLLSEASHTQDEAQDRTEIQAELLSASEHPWTLIEYVSVSQHLSSGPSGRPPRASPLLTTVDAIRPQSAPDRSVCVIQNYLDTLLKRRTDKDTDNFLSR
jgi:hypothetical protein